MIVVRFAKKTTQSRKWIEEAVLEGAGVDYELRDMALVHIKIEIKIGKNACIWEISRG